MKPTLLLVVILAAAFSGCNDEKVMGGPTDFYLINETDQDTYLAITIATTDKDFGNHSHQLYPNMALPRYGSDHFNEFLVFLPSEQLRIRSEFDNRTYDLSSVGCADATNNFEVPVHITLSFDSPEPFSLDSRPKLTVESNCPGIA